MWVETAGIADGVADSFGIWGVDSELRINLSKRESTSCSIFGNWNLLHQNQLYASVLRQSILAKCWDDGSGLAVTCTTHHTAAGSSLELHSSSSWWRWLCFFWYKAYVSSQPRTLDLSSSPTTSLRAALEYGKQEGTIELLLLSLYVPQ